MRRPVESTHAARLASPFTKIAQIISKNHGVRVVPSSGKCCTDGRVIHVPFAAETAKGETLTMLHGMLDHELGHVLVEQECSKRGVRGFVDRMRDAAARGDRELAALMNFVEDIRIENALGREWAGMRDNLMHINESMFNRRKADAASGTHESLWREIGCGFICQAHGLDDSWLAPKARIYLGHCSDLVERARLLEPGVEGMLAGIELAEEWRSRLHKIAEERRKGSRGAAEPRRESDGDSSGGDHPEEYGDGLDELEDEERRGSSAEDEEDEEDEEGRDGAEDDELPASELGEGPDFLDHRDEEREALDRALVEDARVAGIRLPHPVCLDADRWRLGETGDRPGDLYGNVKNEVLGQIGTLRSRQIARIQTRARACLRVGLDDGDLDQSRLQDAAMGARDVYQAVLPGRKVNIAIQVLLDLSGSTRGSCERFMRRTLVALAESWEPTKGVAYDILGFHNLTADIRRIGLPPGLQEDGVHYVRGAFEMIQFKQFHERIATFRNRFREIGPHQDNCDHEAVWMAARRLAGRPEQRKILCVISDGEPMCYGVDGDYAATALRENVSRITRAGIEVWGIGAGTDAPRMFYNETTGARNVVIRNLETMAPTLLKLFSKRIEEAP